MPERIQLPASVGKQIKARRSALGFKQYELAELAQVTQPYLSAVERGQRKTTPALLTRLAVALGCLPEGLTTGQADDLAFAIDTGLIQFARTAGLDAETVAGLARIAHPPCDWAQAYQLYQKLRAKG